MTTQPQPEALPPLPKPAAHLAGWDAGWSQYHDQHDPLPEQWDDKPDCIAALFTADQMRAYATEHAARLHAECEALRRENVKLHGWLKAESQAGGILQRKLDAMEAECEALHAHLTAMCDEFVRTYPIYYYAEPWGHKTNKALLAARAALAARAEKEAM